MEKQPILTTKGKYKVEKHGKWWYYLPIHKTRKEAETGPFFSVAEAIEAAQLFENEYFRK